MPCYAETGHSRPFSYDSTECAAGGSGFTLATRVLSTCQACFLQNLFLFFLIIFLLVLPVLYWWYWLLNWYPYGVFMITLSMYWWCIGYFFWNQSGGTGGIRVQGWFFVWYIKYPTGCILCIGTTTLVCNPVHSFTHSLCTCFFCGCVTLSVFLASI